MRIQELWSRNDEQLLNDFGRFVATDDLTGALLSLGDASSEERVAARAQLAAWGGLISSNLPVGDASAQAVALSRLISVELGFAIDETSSGESIDLARVLERRRGHAVILSSIYREVAADAGLTAEIVALPGKLLVRIGLDSQAFLDPALGRPLGEEEVRAMLLSAKGLAYDPSLLRGSSVAEVLGRALKFTANHHASSGDLVGLYRALSFAAVVRPDRPAARLQQAAVAEELGARELAEDAYRAVAHDFPNTEASEVAALRLRVSRSPSLVQ